MMIHCMLSFQIWHASPNLLNAEEECEFSLWLDKIYEVNKRSLYLYITNNPEKFKPEFHRTINIKFQKHIIG